MANNPDGKYETYHEVPGSKYFFISGPSGVAVHKSFFKYWSLFLVFSTLASTLIAVYTNWWQTLIIMMLTFFYVQYWYIGWPATAITLGIGYFWYTRRQKRIAKERAAQLRRRRFEDATIALGEKGVKNKK